MTEKYQRVNTMGKEMTRSRVIQMWFAAIVLIAVAAVALGATVTIGTGVLLAAMSLVPPAIVLMLWPSVE
jgi:hypothetical protein